MRLLIPALLALSACTPVHVQREACFVKADAAMYQELVERCAGHELEECPHTQEITLKYREERKQCP